MTKSTPTACDWNRYNKNPTNSHQYLLPLVASLGRQAGPRKVLDIGTGNGAALPAWLEQGWEVSAMEPDYAGYEIARSFEGVDVRQLGVGDLLPSDWESAFDLVICLEVVEHLFDPHQLAKASRDALKTGGYAIVSTPYHGYLKNLALSVVDKWDFHHHPHIVGGHIKFWSKPTLKTLFEEHGFKAVSFHGAGRVPYLWNSMVWVFLKP